MVEDSQPHSSPTVTPPSAANEGLNHQAIIVSSNMVLQEPLEVAPAVVQDDLRILSRFWSDGIDEEEDPCLDLQPVDNVQDVEQPFIAALSKSQRKKLRQMKVKNGNSDQCNTRSRAGPRNYA